MNALQHEKDPYKAAQKFEKDPTVSFCNEGAKIFGYDYYERQNLDKDKFTAAVVAAWSQIQRSETEARHVFQVQDAYGNPYTCVMCKTPEGEIEWGELLANSDVVKIIEIADVYRAQVITSVIDTAVKLVKDLFGSQEISFPKEQPIKLANNKSFQLNVAHEVLADPDTNDFSVIVGALKYIIASDAPIEARALKHIIEHKDKYGKEVLQSCFSVVINDADKYAKEIVQQCVSTIIKNRKFFDDNFVKSMLKHIVVNARQYETALVQDCALFIGNGRLWNTELTGMATNIVANIVLHAHEHEIGMVQKCAVSIVNHNKLWNSLIVEQAAMTVAHIVANPSEHEAETINNCAIAILNHSRLWDTKIVKLAVKVVTDITNQPQYKPEIVQNCASSIVNNSRHWNEKIVTQAFEFLTEPTAFESLSSRTMSAMARIVIHSNAGFFNAPTQNQQQFAAFYQTEGRLDDIQRYTEDLVNAAAKDQKVSIVWADPNSEEHAIRYFIKGDIKHDKSLRLRDAFYKEEKEKIACSENKSDDSPGQLVLTIPGLLGQGDFEAAVCADSGLARFIVEHRDDEVITAWNEHVKVGNKK